MVMPPWDVLLIDPVLGMEEEDDDLMLLVNVVVLILVPVTMALMAVLLLRVLMVVGPMKSRTTTEVVRGKIPLCCLVEVDRLWWWILYTIVSPPGTLGVEHIE